VAVAVAVAVMLMVEGAVGRKVAVHTQAAVRTEAVEAVEAG
jgi:hypothetical protein